MEPLVKLLDILKRRAGEYPRYVFTSGHAPKGRSLEEAVNHVLSDIRRVYGFTCDASPLDAVSVAAGYKIYVYDLDGCRNMLTCYHIDGVGNIRLRACYHPLIILDCDICERVYMIVEYEDRSRIPYIMDQIWNILNSIVETWKEDNNRLIFRLRRRPPLFTVCRLIEKLRGLGSRVRIVEAREEVYPL